MQHHYNDIDELIAKRLAEEATPEDLVVLEDWLQENPDNQLYFDQLKQLWTRAPVPALPQVDTEEALLRVKKQIHAPMRGRVSNLYRWSGAAAAAVVLLIAAIYWIQDPAPRSMELVTADQVLQDTLMDGTQVSLNQKSGLNIRVSKQKRSVTMRGEAFFKVTPDTTKPFVIAVQNLEVTVVGTAFNVDNSSDSSYVVVSVEEGKVQLKSKDQTLYLTAGQTASFSCKTNQMTRSQTPINPNVAAYKDRRFVFEETPLSEVVTALSKAYATPILLKNSRLANCKLRVRYNNESLARIMELLAETFTLRIEKKEGIYYLDGNGCD